MKKYLFSILMVMVAMTFTACGDDDDDYEVINTGKQRIEVTVTGDTRGWVIMESCHGYTTDLYQADQSCKISCNQTEYLDKKDNSYLIILGAVAQRTYPVTVTLEGNASLISEIQIKRHLDYKINEVSDITITMKGYKGDKLTNSMSMVCKSNSMYDIFFHADKKDDKLGIEGVGVYDNPDNE